MNEDPKNNWSDKIDALLKLAKDFTKKWGPFLAVCATCIYIGWHVGTYRNSRLKGTIEDLQTKLENLTKKLEYSETVNRSLQNELDSAHKELVIQRQGASANSFPSNFGEPRPRNDVYFTTYFTKVYHRVSTPEQLEVVMAPHREGLIALSTNYDGRSVRDTPRKSLFYVRPVDFIGYRYKEVPFPIITSPEGAFELHHTSDGGVFVYGFVDEESGRAIFPVTLKDRIIHIFSKPVALNTSLVRISLSRIKNLRSSKLGGKHGAIELTVHEGYSAVDPHPGQPKRSVPQNRP